MLYALFTLLLVAVLPSCTLPAAIICRTPKQQCPDGQYCDLGISKCMDCETVCDRNNKLRNVAQCRKKCPDYAYLLSDQTDHPVKLPNTTKHTPKGPTAAPVTIPTPPRETKGNPGNIDGQTQDDNSPGSSDLQAPLLFLLVLLVVVVVVLALGLVIALIVYLTRQIIESKARAAEGYTKDFEKNGDSLLRPTE